jgi:hypothetical protein
VTAPAVAPEPPVAIASVLVAAVGQPQQAVQLHQLGAQRGGALGELTLLALDRGEGGGQLALTFEHRRSVAERAPTAGTGLGHDLG